MTIYSCAHDGDQYRITKFDRDGNVQSSYLCNHVSCQCPAGVRDTCRHRQMLPAFLSQDLVNSHLFLDWDNGRRIVDFNGLPATVQSNVHNDRTTFTIPEGYEAVRDTDGRATGEVRPTDILTPQALTDTYAQPDTKPAEYEEPEGDGSEEQDVPESPNITPTTSQPWRRW